MNDKARGDRLLMQILSDVPFDGWTSRMLKRAGEQTDLSPGDVAMLLPGGVADALTLFSDWADAAAIGAADAADGFDEMKVREKIAFLVRARLEALEEHREALRRSLGALLAPQHAGLATRLLYRTCDRLWRRAGDAATDHNFYTKRALLAGVYASTQLYWLNDRSEGRTDSLAYLDRRIAAVLTIGRRLGGGVSSLGRLAEAPFRVAARLRERAMGTG
ncbi:MAG: COQ9 family protein [Azospirillaceae bacterium]